MAFPGVHPGHGVDVNSAEYLQAVLRFNRWHNPDPESDATMDLRSILEANSESGELAGEATKAITAGQPLDPLVALDEWGDVLFNVVRGLHAAGFTVEDAMRANVAKLDHRVQYGKDKEAERALLERLVTE